MTTSPGRRLPRGACQTNALRVECAHGHPFDARNTYVWLDRQGRPHRYCRACNRIRQAIRAAVRRTAAVTEATL
jgi:hypothetical protein